MKLLFSILLCAFSVTANAKATKVCFWYDGGSGESRGNRFQAVVSLENLEVSKVIGGNAWDGKYKASGNTVAGKDGQTYLDFDAEGEEGCNSVLVDQRLIHAGTKGVIKFRCRGEGFNDEKFLCRDSN